VLGLAGTDLTIGSSMRRGQCIVEGVRRFEGNVNGDAIRSHPAHLLARRSDAHPERVHCQHPVDFSASLVAGKTDLHLPLDEIGHWHLKGWNLASVPFLGVPFQANATLADRF